MSPVGASTRKAPNCVPLPGSSRAPLPRGAREMSQAPGRPYCPALPIDHSAEELPAVLFDSRHHSDAVGRGLVVGAGAKAIGLPPAFRRDLASRPDAAAAAAENRGPVGVKAAHVSALRTEEDEA